jgi:hypothetical protein
MTIAGEEAATTAGPEPSFSRTTGAETVAAGRTCCVWHPVTLIHRPNRAPVPASSHPLLLTAMSRSSTGVFTGVDRAGRSDCGNGCGAGASGLPAPCPSVDTQSRARPFTALPGDYIGSSARVQSTRSPRLRHLPELAQVSLLQQYSFPWLANVTGLDTKSATRCLRECGTP